MGVLVGIWVDVGVAVRVGCKITGSGVLVAFFVLFPVLSEPEFGVAVHLFPFQSKHPAASTGEKLLVDTNKEIQVNVINNKRPNIFFIFFLSGIIKLKRTTKQIRITNFNHYFNSLIVIPVFIFSEAIYSSTIFLIPKTRYQKSKTNNPGGFARVICEA